LSAEKPLLILNVSALSAVGEAAESTFAALRAKFNNHRETDFTDQDWNLIVGSRATIDPHLFGEGRLVEMAACAIRETLNLSKCSVDLLPKTPILLCLAEQQRIGAVRDELNLLNRILDRFSAKPHPESLVVPLGRTAGFVALQNAQQLLYEKGFSNLLIVAVDSLIDSDLLQYLDQTNQLLTPENSNGFIPGEAASACWVRKPNLEETGLWWLGAGLTVTDPNTTIPKEKKRPPIDGQELGLAMQLALQDANVDPDAIALRVADVNGSDASFKESAMAEPYAFQSADAPLPAFWMPAESLGEVGAAWLPIAAGWIDHASRHCYSPGAFAIIHATNDAGLRAAAIFECRYQTMNGVQHGS
jgi:3-oxoacyl-[acyl-carrier-protein] synthase I